MSLRFALTILTLMQIKNISPFIRVPYFIQGGRESAGSKATALRNTRLLNPEEWLIFLCRIVGPWMGEANAAFATPVLMWQKEPIVISLLKLMESPSTVME